jgi:hypothetical protein
VEERAANLLVPLTLFHCREFTGANLLTFCLYAALGSTFFYLHSILFRFRVTHQRMQVGHAA